MGNDLGNDQAINLREMISGKRYIGKASGAITFASFFITNVAFYLISQKK